MGAWDTTSFGNDRANDWAYDLQECHDLSLIRSTLERVAAIGEENIDATLGEDAVAAAEVLAWLKGKGSPPNAYTKKIGEWVNSHPIEPPSDLIALAIQIIDRLRREPSELLELWDDDDWVDSLEELKSRLM